MAKDYGEARVASPAAHESLGWEVEQARLSSSQSSVPTTCAVYIPSPLLSGLDSTQRYMATGRTSMER